MRGGKKSGWLTFFWVFGGRGCTGRVSSSGTLRFLVLGFFGAAERVAERVVRDVGRGSGAVSTRATGFALLLRDGIVRTRGGGRGERGHSAMQFIYVYDDRKKEYLIGVGKNLGTIATAKHKARLSSHSLTLFQKGISHQYSLHQISWSSELSGCEAGSYTSA